jgi:hypothetical protein
MSPPKQIDNNHYKNKIEIKRSERNRSLTHVNNSAPYEMRNIAKKSNKNARGRWEEIGTVTPSRWR